MNWALALYYKGQIRRKRKVFYFACGLEGVGFYKNDKEILNEECPKCDDSDVKLYPANSIEQLEKVLAELRGK